MPSLCKSCSPKPASVCGAVRWFDRTVLGRVSRTVYWSSIAAHIALVVASGAALLEVAYRLQCAPDSLFVQSAFWGWVLLVLATVMPIWRLSRRRLHDAGFCGWWLMGMCVPFLGWVLLLVLLLLPSEPRLNRFDTFVPNDDAALDSPSSRAQKT